jgi:ATP-binding cassette, subfamily B, bacterial
MLKAWFGKLAKPEKLFDARAWRYLYSYYRTRRLALAGCALMASAQTLLVLPALYLVRFAFDTAIPRGDLGLLVWVGAGLLLARSLSSAVGLLTRWLTVRLVKDAVSRMRQDLVALLYALSIAFHRETDTDRLRTRIVQETERIDTMSGVLLSVVLPAMFATVVLLAVLLWLNAALVVLAACIVPLLWLAGRVTGGVVRRHVTGFQRAFEDFSAGIGFVLRHVDLTRLRDWERQEQARQHRNIENLRRTGVRMAMGYAMHGQVQSNVTGIAGIMLLVAGGMAVARHAMSLGEFLAFYLAAGQLNTYVERIAGAVPDLISGNASLATLLGISEAGPFAPYRGTRSIDFRGAIQLRDVTFGYGARTVLRDLSLTIEPGACVAIVGPNGAGKTTLLDIVIGFSRPLAGEVLADGVPYDELDIGALRRTIGMVPQHPGLFFGTVYENISYGQPDVTDAAMSDAVRRAGADGFLSRLKLGLDTPIGEGGQPFSAGECQRIAIARALLGDPRLLILDEPTTHLDVEAVRRLMSGLVTRHHRPAILIVSHDPEVVQFADTVWRLENGAMHRMDAPVSIS